MAEQSKIEWTDATFNPWRGCTKVSEGCKNCYADTLSKRNPLMLGVWGPSGTRVVASESTWREPLKWNRRAGEGRLPDGTPNPDGHRPRVFCASLADVFEGPETMPAGSVAEVTAARLRLFSLIHRTPNLDWLLLTKRPQNAAEFFADPYLLGRIQDAHVLRNAAHEPQYLWWHDTAPGWPWPNVWIGTSVENQAAADERIPHLLRVPAAVRFLSCEPLLGPVDLGLTVQTCDCCPRRNNRWIRMTSKVRAETPHLPGETGRRFIGPGGVYRANSNRHGALDVDGLGVKPDEFERLGDLHWVISGGESGPGARPSHPDWFRGLRGQCAAAGVAFFHKQNGEYGPGLEGSGPIVSTGEASGKHAVVESGGRTALMVRVGKKVAGRLLDGREHDEYPEPPR